MPIHWSSKIQLKRISVKQKIIQLCALIYLWIKSTKCFKRHFYISITLRHLWKLTPNFRNTLFLEVKNTVWYFPVTSYISLSITMDNQRLGKMCLYCSGEKKIKIKKFPITIYPISFSIRCRDLNSFTTLQYINFVIFYGAYMDI